VNTSSPYEQRLTELRRLTPTQVSKERDAAAEAFVKATGVWPEQATGDLFGANKTDRKSHEQARIFGGIYQRWRTARDVEAEHIKAQPTRLSREIQNTMRSLGAAVDLVVERDRHRPGFVVGAVPCDSVLSKTPRDKLYTSEDGRAYLPFAHAETEEELHTVLLGMNTLWKMLIFGCDKRGPR